MIDKHPDDPHPDPRLARHRATHWPLATLLWITLAASGCVKAPDVVLTDQRTALEQQAAGEYRALENDLHQEGIAPKGEDITREALEAKNPDMARSTLGEVVQLYSAVQTDSEWVDQLLVAGCIGEAKDGLLQQLPDTCSERVDTGQLARVVERANLHRRQLWRLIRKRQPDASEDEVREKWRANHLEQVVCGATVQKGDDAWEKKEC